MRRRFRVAGVLLGILFHVVMLGLTSVVSDQGTAWLIFFIWYGGSIALGLPWSIVALLAGPLDAIGLAAAVCLNGYLIGWVIDWLAAPSEPRLRSYRSDTVSGQLF